MNRFIFAEPSKCIGCRTCEVACVLSHSGTAGVEALSSASFAPRLRVVKSQEISVPVTCRHCEDAPCVNACPNAAIVYRNNSVQVLQDRCVGCKTCVMACPFGAMDVINVPATKTYAGVTLTHGLKAEAHKCDLCAERDLGPACISVCPTKALHVFDRAAMDLTLRRRQERAALEAAGTPSL
jgi:electron transport protein HydN